MSTRPSSSLKAKTEKKVNVAVKQQQQQSCASACLKKWVVRLGVFAVLYAVWAYLDTIKHRWYVFDPESLNKIANEAISLHGNDTQSIINHIVASLHSAYPQIQASPSDPAPRTALNADTSEWVFNNAGGAMGAMYVIHASITEYLIIFGTPLGTEGHSGLHTADDYFNILVGEQWAFKAGALEKEVYRPGDVHWLKRGEVKQYKMHKGCFALEYARGWIPLMLPFGFADFISSTLDYPSFFKTVHISAREMGRNLLLGKI